MVKHVGALEHLGITPLTRKTVKNSKKSAIMDHNLLEYHKYYIQWLFNSHYRKQ